ncbi:MAG TPA: hypothetical protein VKV95_18070 [Terriglobia bacterium]|nr:hypothetical protein [Terriglobia bacterium]
MQMNRFHRLLAGAALILGLLAYAFANADVSPLQENHHHGQKMPSEKIKTKGHSSIPM